MTRMSAAIIRCPACQRALRLSPEMQGRTVKWAACARKFGAEGPDTPAAVPKSARPAPAPRVPTSDEVFGFAPEPAPAAKAEGKAKPAHQGRPGRPPRPAVPDDMEIDD